MKTVALYLRVSTGEQTVDNQRRELLAAAERRGWRVVAEFCDEGVSGAQGPRQALRVRSSAQSDCPAPGRYRRRMVG